MNVTRQKIETILQGKYDLKNYEELISELFTGISFAAPDLYIEASSNFKSHIAGYSHIGNYKTADNKKLIIAAVELKKATYVENARSTQRSFAKNLIEKRNADAAIIAFYTKDEPKWRLSFVRLDYEIQFGTTGFKTTEKLTPAKRYSYLVGENEPCHTALSRFNKLLITTADNHITLDELEEIFSVEKVTDEFFKFYCEKFHQLREQLESNENFKIEAQQHNFTAAQFAKKLLGQIVFLYFLQKKGWLGVKAWPNTLNEKEYKAAYFARGSKSRELIPIVYRPIQNGEYHVINSGLNSISDEDEAVLATCVKGKPWGSGPHNFMRKLFELAEKRQLNFFDDLLEPLFYDALNVNRGEQGYCPALHCRIPFLSGGLFEPIDGYEWKYNNFGIKNELFSNKDKNGILDIFDRYNFTISEDEPLEREVAIDPEMLGKVFENLLEVRDRKSKGAFYTPREIVHYMCQESLINYLTNALQIDEPPIRNFILYGDLMKDEDTAKAKFPHNNMLISKELFLMDETGKVTVNRLEDMDKALQDIRVADPAVGSGAFPLGMLNEIVKARQNISAYKAITQNAYENRMMYQTDRAPWRLKYETIRNCIFAADIDPSAVDIAQLRLWLSLVIDDEINPKAESDLDGHRNPLPLPNLECNILCGNSLIDEIAGIKLINESELFGNTTVNTQIETAQSQIDTIIKKLIEKQDELYRCDNTDKKKQLKAAIDHLRDEIIMLQMRGCIDEQIERYHKSKKMASKPYVLWQLDFAKVFREKGGFDVVIGNPPYVGEKGNKELFRPIAATQFGHKYYCGKMDLFYFFFHKAIDIGNENAEIYFITTNYYPTAFGGKILRKDFKERTQIRRMINLNELKVFESALGQHNMITMLTKNHSQNITAHNSICKHTGIANSNLLREFLYNLDDKNEFIENYYIQQTDLYEGDEYYLRISGCTTENTDPANVILTKISDTTLLLKNIAHIKQGIVSGADKYTDAHQIKFALNLPKGKGIFILTKEELASLNLTDLEKAKYVKPVYKNGQISKYCIEYNDELYVLYITRETIISEIPNILSYLQQFKPLLQQRLTTYNENYPWYALHRERSIKILNAQEKIVNSRRALSNIFALETKHYFEQSDIMITVIKDEYYKTFPPKYILGLLNSKLMYVWLLKRGKLKGKSLELYGKPLEEIPIKEPTPEIRDNVVNAVTEILKLDKQNKECRVKLMQIIDQNIYRLYNLSDSEITILENLNSD